MKKKEKFENTLCDNKDILQTIIDAFPYPFHVIDAKDYKIKLANKVAGKCNGNEGVTCYEKTHGNKTPCSGDKHICPLKKIKQTKKPFIVEHVHKNADGNDIFVEVHGYPIFNNKGEFVQMIEYFIDITEKKNMENEMRKQMNKLERLNGAMVGRELKMIELKEELKHLRNKIKNTGSN